MTTYMQNGADDGTIIAYPDEVGSEIEDFLYDVCGQGQAYPVNPVQEIDENEVIEQGYSLDEFTVVPDDVIVKCRELMEDEEMDESDIRDALNDLVAEYCVCH